MIRFAARTSCVTQLQYHLRLAERRCFPRRDVFGLARLAVARFEARLGEVVTRARLAIFFRPRVVVLLLPGDALFFLVATAAFFLPPDMSFFLAGVIPFAALLDRGLLSAVSSRADQSTDFVACRSGGRGILANRQRSRIWICVLS